jgi:hypothetical protein
VEHHLVNLLDLAVDIAANLGMGVDSRYGRIYSQLVPLLEAAAKLAVEMEQAEPIDYFPEDYEDNSVMF